MENEIKRLIDLFGVDLSIHVVNEKIKLLNEIKEGIERSRHRIIDDAIDFENQIIVKLEEIRRELRV